MTVCVMDMRDNSYRTVYDCIPTLEETDLLAQLAMSNKQDYELVFVFTGYNRGIKDKELEYQRALQLAKEYKDEKPRVCKGHNNDLNRFKKIVKGYVDSL